MIKLTQTNSRVQHSGIKGVSNGTQRYHNVPRGANGARIFTMCAKSTLMQPKIAPCSKFKQKIKQKSD